MDTRKHQVASANLAFSALLYSLCALALIAAWNLKAGAGLRLHVITEAIALWLLAMAFRRFRLERPSMAIIDGTAKHRIWQYVMLAAIGSALGLLTLAGSVAQFGVCAVGINWIPWSRIALCRNNLLAACASVLGGGASVMLATGLPRESTVLPLVAWALGLIVCFNLIYLAIGKQTGALAADRQDGATRPREMALGGSDAG